MPAPHDPAEILANPRVTLMGVPGSPYTRKMLALLRYRQVPYRLLLGSNVAGGGLDGLPVPRVPMLPTFFLPGDDGTLCAVTDSTPLIRRFEASHPGRCAVPGDSALALLDALLEDYADEWLTKAMFHYRWTYAADIAKAGDVLPTWARPPMTDEALNSYATLIRDRQIPRLRYVGSNEITGPVIEASYQRFLDIFEDHLRSHRFLLGARPGSSDFGAFGQLTQLAHFDPTCMAETVSRAPRVYGWVGSVEDLSGLRPIDDDWFDIGALPATTRALLAEQGRTYVPVMLANERALKAGDAQVRCEVDGRPWEQQAFPYQAKCLGWLRRDYAALDAASRARFDAAIAASGCEALFA